MRRFRGLALGVVVAILVLAAPPASGESVGQRDSQATGERADRVSDVVRTQGGRVRGFGAGGGVLTFLGIPYAHPPLGDLRWRAPQPAAPWAGIRDATHQGSMCVQLEGVPVGSEDCLFLNVFVPAKASERDRLPVMVHLHPGGNAVGEGYDEATALVSRDVVVVTLNYRLNSLGFLGHPALTAEAGSSANYGLLDQIAALRWVQDNIGAFGGDPRRVTLFGMSAGSHDTVALAASPLTHGLFAQAAIEGAVPFGDPLDLTYEPGLELATNVGCESAPDVAACLREVPASELVASQPQWFSDIAPVRDGYVLPDRPHTLIADRDIPLLLGTNREERSARFLGSDLTPETVTEEDYIALVNEAWGPFAEEILRLYPASDYDYPFWALVAGDTDFVYTCATRRLALAAASAPQPARNEDGGGNNDHEAPIWRYLYTHVFDGPDDSGFDLPGLRASHRMEDAFIWNSFSSWAYTPSPAERQLSETMTSYWTNFAKHGDPNGRGLVSWPRYLPDSERILNLDTPTHAEGAYHVEQCDLIERIHDIVLP
jgi:para-nitrobenzyl esterase